MGCYEFPVPEPFLSTMLVVVGMSIRRRMRVNLGMHFMVTRLR